MTTIRMGLLVLGTLLVLDYGRQESSQLRSSDQAPAAFRSTIQTLVPSVSAAGPRKLALLVGINSYKYPNAVSPLLGAVHDIEDMQSLLVSYGFSTTDIVMLPDKKATRVNIVKSFQEHLIAKATPGDIVVFHFSGHGSQMVDPQDRLGYDNTLVPYDSRDPGKTTTDLAKNI